MTLWRDIRYAIKNLGRTPGFAVSAIATLTMTIGASTAAFSVVNCILLQPLPFKDPERLVSLGRIDKDSQSLSLSFSSRILAPLRDQSRTLAILAASQTDRARRDDTDRLPEIVRLKRVTPGYFELLEVQPELGRLFSSDELLLDGTKEAVVTYGYWQEHWGGTSGILGERLRLQGQPVMTIVGVLPQTFRNPLTGELPFPVLTSLEVDSGLTNQRIQIIGRLRPGQTVLSAQDEMNVVALRIAEEYPERDGRTGILVRSLLDGVVNSEARQGVFIFTAAVGALLLIGVLNLVISQASRISKQTHNLSIRAALGASRWRIVRQMIVESTVLTSAGATFGYLVVHWTRDLTLARMPPLLPRMDSIAVDGRAFAFAVVVALATGLVIGAIPAIGALRLDVNGTLKEAIQGTTATPGQRRLSSALIVIETSLAVSLLVGAGLLVQSFGQLVSHDLGFDPKGIKTVRVVIPQRYSGGGHDAFLRTVLDKIRSLPEVQLVSVANALLREDSVGGTIRAEGVETKPTGILREVSSEYASVMRIPQLSGRWLSEEDVEVGARVVVVSESMARGLWPGQNPLSKRLIGPFDEAGSWRTVVGLVPDIRTSMARDPEPVVYAPYTANFVPPLRVLENSMVFVVRPVEVSDARLRDVIRNLEPNSVVTVRNMEDMVSNTIQMERFQTVILASFASVALVLAMVGIYSVVAFATTRRVREIGLRIALGATGGSVTFQMMREGVFPALAGMSLGLACSASLTTFFGSYLGTVQPNESSTYSLIVALGVSLVLLATWLPASRASKVDPIMMLRHE